MTTSAKPSRRILIGAGSFADARAALLLAERLGGMSAAEVGGLLMEEVILSEIADLPRQRVITSSGRLIIAPSQRQIRTLIESDAKAFQSMLSGLARTKKCFFERRRGELISGLCDAAKDWDMLLLGHRDIHRLTGHVVLIAPPPNTSRASVNVAKELALALQTETTSVSFGEAAEKAHAEEYFSTEDALMTRVGRIHASAVVLDLSAGPLRTYDQLRRLLAAARCPIVVLGAAQGEPSVGHSTLIPPAPETQTDLR